jgi:carbamate kinase
MSSAQKRIVIAVGGNALIENKDKQSEQDQYLQVYKTCQHIFPLIEAGHQVVITHGNGPQVGFILQRAEIAFEQTGMDRVPIDVADAQTQGAIGYFFVRALHNLFLENKISKKAVALITHVEVDPKDAGYQNPSKPIGTFYPKSEAKLLSDQYGWTMKEDAGRDYRRVVPSPLPKKILEKEIILDLITQSHIVIACGGGGIPVIADKNGLQGSEAVIDKDRTGALLANELKADIFVVATAVDFVYLDFNKPTQKKLEQVTYDEMSGYLKAGHFAEGSMKPKIEAVLAFLKDGGKKAIITSPEQLGNALKDLSGTHITQ